MQIGDYQLRRSVILLLLEESQCGAPGNLIHLLIKLIVVVVVIFYYSDMGEDCYIVICYKRNDRTTPPAIVGL